MDQGDLQETVLNYAERKKFSIRKKNRSGKFFYAIVRRFTNFVLAHRKVSLMDLHGAGAL
jgi:hypothetical protein